MRLLVCSSILFLPFYGCVKQDQDEDGFGISEGDCDDDNHDINPAAQEVCDGVDNDCDGEIDGRYARGGRIFYGDADGDGFGSESVQLEACEAPLGYAEQKWDCDEGDPETNPDAIEVCDGKDNDCDDVIDENTAVDAIKWYADYDGDGYGDDTSEYTSCEAPPDFVSIPGDCNVLDPLVHPGATERCDTEIDDNCNGDNNDIDSIGCIDYYADHDGDGFTGTAACFCIPTEEYYSEDQEDCRDDDILFHPDMDETSALLDSNCDGLLIWQDNHHKITSEVSSNFGLDFDISDRNNDSFSDIIVYGGSGAYVFDGPIMDHETTETAHLVLPGQRGWWIPDINNDGIKDIINYYQLHPGWAPGEVYLFSGDSTGNLVPDDAIMTWTGSDGDFLGIFTPTVRDVTGDGLPDMLLSSRSTDTINIYTLGQTISESPDIILYPTGSSNGSRTIGEPMGTDYDFNGDGFPDLAVSDTRASVSIPHDLMFNPFGRVAVYESPLVDGAEPDWSFYGHSGFHGKTPPLAVDINNDGHLDLVYIDPELGFGQTKSGVVAIKLGPFGYPHFDMLSWSSVLDAEYWITGAANEKLNQATIGPDLNANGQAELILSSTETQTIYLLESPSPGHTFVREEARIIQDTEEDSHFAHSMVEAMLIDGTPTLITGRHGNNELIFIFGGEQ